MSDAIGNCIVCGARVLTSRGCDACADRVHRKLDRLAAIERQVLWRTEDMPEIAKSWTKSPTGLHIRFRDYLGQAITDAPDYRPDESGPLFLPILDPEGQ